MLVICAAASSAPLQAQPSDDELTPISQECQSPGVTVSVNRPLPNTLKALRRRKVLKILAIGASGSGGSDEWGAGYHDVIEVALEKKLTGIDVQIVERGVSGELTSDAAVRLQTEVALNLPDLVLWQTGTNDALAHIPVDEFSEALTGGIRWLRAHNVDVVLVGQHYIYALRKDRHYQAIRGALRRVSRREKVLRISRYEAMRMIEKLKRAHGQPNEFALTEEGYSCLAEYVVRAITSSVLTKRASRKKRGGFNKGGTNGAEGGDKAKNNDAKKRAPHRSGTPLAF
ncbi:MAG: GDSL-type esterase/lipase family protein [Alphaproteobacteria bacterium]